MRLEVRGDKTQSGEIHKSQGKRRICQLVAMNNEAEIQEFIGTFTPLP